MRHRPIVLVSWILFACGGPADDPRPPTELDRTPDVPAAPEPSEEGPVVVFLGTSLTAGLGLLRPEDTYVAVLTELADSAGVPFRARNAGVSGDTSAGGLRRLDWVLRDSLDVLFLELGANDGLRGQDPSATRENLIAIVQRTRRRYPGARVLVASMEAPTNLGSRYTEAFRGIFPEVARAEDAVLVPFLLEGVAGVASLNQADGIHPTAEGHERMARNVWPALESVLRQWSAAQEPGPERP